MGRLNGDVANVCRFFHCKIGNPGDDDASVTRLLKDGGSRTSRTREGPHRIPGVETSF